MIQETLRELKILVTADKKEEMLAAAFQEVERKICVDSIDHPGWKALTKDGRIKVIVIVLITRETQNQPSWTNLTFTNVLQKFQFESWMTQYREDQAVMGGQQDLLHIQVDPNGILPYQKEDDWTSLKQSCEWLDQSYSPE